MPLRARFFILLWLVGGSACSTKHPVGEVRVSGEALESGAELGMSAQEVESRFRRALESTGRFRLLQAGGREARDAASLSLEVAVARAPQKDDDGGNAEVGVVLGIRQRFEGVVHRYELTALGEAPLTAPDARSQAMRSALDDALQQVVEEAQLQLRALSRSDVELLREVRTGSGTAREAAIRVLSHRQNHEVADVLIERLRSSGDPEVVRQAIGALSAMRERRAVQPLIELTRGKDAGFVREVLFAVSQIGGEEAAAWLFTVAQGHDDETLREAARRALSEMEKTSKGVTR